MRHSDYFAIRCEPDLRNAVMQIAGPGGFSRAVRTALLDWIERQRPQQPEQTQRERQERRQ